MHRTCIAIGCGAAMALTGSASADIIQFNFPIDAAQEVPAPTIPDGFSPSGTGEVILNTDINEISWVITYGGLSGDIVAPGAHFHGPAGFGDTAGIEVFIAGDTAEPLPQPPQGQLVGFATLTDQQEADLIAGLWYVNIHTELNPAGEIRGQVIPAPAGAIALVAVAGMAGVRRRRG